MKYCLLFSLVCSCACAALPPKLSLKPSSEVTVEGSPIVLTLSIIHSFDQKIEQNNLTMDHPILSIEKISDEVVNPDNIYEKEMKSAPVVTRFRIILPPKPSGIYTLGPVHLELDRYLFDSNSVTINVQIPVISPTFRLEARLPQKTGVVYPEESVTFEYRLFSSTQMKLTKEDLPLLRPTGFVTEGGPAIREEKGGGDSLVQIITQRAKAKTPGTYDMGISTVEGFRYIQGPSGAEVIPPLYKAIAPSITVSILPFPTEGRPTSFHGAIGSYAWRSRLLSSNTIKVGEIVDIEYRASGRGDIATVTFPARDAFANIDDFFIIDSWPQDGTIVENTKTFSMRLKPRRSGKISVPGTAIASFDPASMTYLTVPIPPIALTVIGEEVAPERRIIQEGEMHAIGPIAITKNTLSKADWTGYAVVWTGIFSTLFMLLQLVIRAMWEKRQRESGDASASALFEQAIIATRRPRHSLALLRQAIFARLFETGLIEKKTENIHDITGSAPVVEDAKSLILRIDSALYLGQTLTRSEFQGISEDSVLLYHRMKQL